MSEISVKASGGSVAILASSWIEHLANHEDSSVACSCMMPGNAGPQLFRRSSSFFSCVPRDAQRPAASTDVPRYSEFRFKNSQGASWTMVCRFDQAGHVFRYAIGNDGSECFIATQYFDDEWYYDASRLQWSTCLRNLTHKRFLQALRELAQHYLEWYEHHVFHAYNRRTRKDWSHNGVVGGRDLTNKVYWVCVQAALTIRRQNGFHALPGVASCSSEGAAGDIIEGILGIVWDFEETNRTLSNDLMMMRTCVEAAALGVEHVLSTMPWMRFSQIITSIANSTSDFTVRLPEPDTMAWTLQRDQQRLYDARVEARNRLKLTLARLFVKRNSVAKLIAAFIQM